MLNYFGNNRKITDCSEHYFLYQQDPDIKDYGSGEALIMI